MKHPILCILALLACLVFGGCDNYPMGLNEQQWNALNPTQQAEYRARQTEIDQENNRRQEARREAEERDRRAAQEREQFRIAELYRHARQGDIITVSISGGQVAFYGKRHEFEPLAFDLVRGEHREVEFRRRGKGETTRVEVALSEDGNTFYFDHPSRKHYVFINKAWDRGEEYQPYEIRGNDGYSEAIGLTIHIRHKALERRQRH